MNNYFKYILCFMLLQERKTVFACKACEMQQPRITRGITHGVGPESNFEWLVIIFIIVVTIVILFYSIKFLIKPGETEKSHIKQSMLNLK